MERLKKNKSGSILNQVIIHILLVGLIFAVFFMATAGKVNSRGVKQQVVEREVALLIDAAVPGMSFEVRKGNIGGSVSKIELKDGKIFAVVDGLSSFEGYPYFSRFSVSVVEEGDKFVVKIK